MEDYRVREVIQKILSQLVVGLVLAVLIPTDTETSEVFNSPNATVALTGDNVILPCSLRTPTSLAGLVVEWTRSDLKDMIVHINREGHDIEDQNPNYKGRTSMFPEELKNGNISLKLHNLKISDSGQYTCDVPSQNGVHKAVVQLVVGAVSQPVISILGPKDYGVVLNCDTGGWYPEPEMTWVDSDGNILPDHGPTETETDSEGRYTVRGHVTVQKTDNNRFTCTVLQQQINHKMETEIHVPDNTFPKSHGGLIAAVIIGILLAVVAGVVAVFMWRKKKQLKEYEKVTKNELEEKDKHVEELEVICVDKEEQAKRLEYELEEQEKLLKTKEEQEKLLKQQLEEKEKLLKQQLEEKEKLLKQQQEEADAVEFVKRHKDQIIKVNNHDVKVIAKELLENHLISLEVHNNIRKEWQRMLKLYNIIDSGGPNVKLGFYRILKKHQPNIFTELDKQTSDSESDHWWFYYYLYPKDSN